MQFLRTPKAPEPLSPGAGLGSGSYELSMYKETPVGEVALEEFEKIALDRLRSERRRVWRGLCAIRTVQTLFIAQAHAWPGIAPLLHAYDVDAHAVPEFAVAQHQSHTAMRRRAPARRWHQPPRVCRLQLLPSLGSLPNQS